MKVLKQLIRKLTDFITLQKDRQTLWLIEVLYAIKMDVLCYHFKTEIAVFKNKVLTQKMRTI